MEPTQQQTIQPPASKLQPRSAVAELSSDSPPQQPSADAPRSGRPSKLSYALIDEIAEQIARGNYIECAAAMAGLCKQTVYNWLRQGRRDEEDGIASIHLDFLDAVRRAQAQAEARDVAVVDEAAANGSWRAAAWRLERRHPQRWAKPSARASRPDPIEDEDFGTERRCDDGRSCDYERLWPEVHRLAHLREEDEVDGCAIARYAPKPYDNALPCTG